MATRVSDAGPKPAGARPIRRRVRLLELEASLARELPPREREAAADALVVTLVGLPPGEWAAPRVEPEPGHLGYLIADGLMTRRLRVGAAGSVELLTTGDLLRPWDEDAASFVEASWVVHEALELAVLDRRVAQAVGRWPELVAALAERGLRRSRSLAVHAAIENIRGIDRRLLALFWHFAERWGERGPDGVRVPLELTHQMLSELVGARRPSVTTALGVLRREGLLEPVNGAWVLRGEPPATAEPAPGGVAAMRRR